MASAVDIIAQTIACSASESHGPAGATPNSPLTPPRPSWGGGEGGRS